METNEVVELYRKGIEDGSAGDSFAFVPKHLHEYRLERAFLAITHLHPANVLDVGCGVGSLSERIACPYHGVDPVAELIRRALTRPRNGATFQVGTAADVADTYEMVVTMGVLAHIAPDEVLEFIRPAIKAGTKYLLIEAQHIDAYKGKFHAHDPEDLKANLAEFGFEWQDLDFDADRDSSFRLIGVRK